MFHKGRELYGLYEARQAHADFKRLKIVEGYMDVVRLHQSGITYAVATLGTATTQEHLNKIFRLTSELIFCFDGDAAGESAALRRKQMCTSFGTQEEPKPGAKLFCCIIRLLAADRLWYALPRPKLYCLQGVKSI